MYCAKCGEHVADCQCLDIDERLAEIGQHPNILIARCARCEKHIDRCTCPKLRGNGHQAQREGDDD